MTLTKSTLTIASIATALIFGGGVYLLMNLDSIAKTLTERVASETLGVDVDIGEIQISLKEKSVIVRSVEVSNPPGYHAPHAATIDRIAMKANQLSDVLLSFEDISVTGTEMFLEVTPQGTNLTDIRNNVNAKAAQGDSAAEQIKVIIARLKIEKLHVVPGTLLIGREMEPITISNIVLRNIGRENNGVSASQAIAEVWKAVSRDVTRRAANAGFLKGLDKDALEDIGASGLQPFKDRLSDDLGTLGEDIKGVFGD